LPPDEPTSIDSKSESINDTEFAPPIPAPPAPPPPPPSSIPYDSYPYNYYSYYNYGHPPLAPIASSSSLPNQQQTLSYPSFSAQLPANYGANCNSLPNPADATPPPLNQYQEVTSTNTPSSNVADTFKRHSPTNKISSNETQSLKSSNKNEHDLPSERAKIKTETALLDEQASRNETNKYKSHDDDEDLVAFKNKIQIQLKEKLFNDNLKSSLKSANSSRSVSSSSTNNSLIEEDGKSKDANREKRHHRHHHKHHKRHKHHHHRHKHHKHKKERHSKTDSKEKTKPDQPYEEDNDFDDDEHDFDQERSQRKKSLRRSDRIKVIETKKQHHKELVIAEKIKKHHTHTHDSNSNDGIENGTPRSDSEHCNDISLAANQSEDFDKMPAVKVKDRWRRFSEKELCENSDQLLNKSSTTVQLVSTNLNSPCKAESTTFSPNKFDSPRAFKKMLLNKAACESLDSQQSSSSIIISSSECNVDFKELYSLYDHIDENLYLCTKKKTKFNKEAKRMVCDCSTSEQERQMGIVACGDDCLNRLLMIECGIRCACGEYCTNRNFKTKNNAKIQPFKTEMKGYGLKAANDLKANTFLIEYIGEVIGLKEFKKRCEKYSAQNNEHFYFMSLHNDLFIDATKKGNISRFFNHSCDPNCETQKWTVNGELRIGFFTKRPVGVNEELSFDYQFQTVGKKQQKCYCGSEKCRGYLGVSSKDGASNSLSGALNHMWEQESDEEDDDEDEDSNEDEDDDDDEENGENKESNDENVVNEEVSKSKNRSSSKRKRQHSTKSHGKHKRKSKDRKKRRSNKDFELNSQIKSIDSLSNKENVLKLCQLMYRTESLESRIDILNLLLSTESEISLRLFMDYLGLKLLWSWMADLDSINDSISHLECKIKILKVLSMMSIKNRTTLEESKLLAIVKKWSETNNAAAAAAKTIENGPNESESDAELNETLGKKKLNDTEKWVRSEILKIADSVADKEAKHHHQSKEISDAYKQLVEQASELVDEWSNLKQEFKIPKKQRDEERKEHERELNSTSDAHRVSSQQANTANNSVNANENYSNEKNRDYKHRNRYANKRNPSRNYHDNYYSQNQGYNQFYQHPDLTKEQRRHLFEQHIKEQEAAAAAAQASQEAERVAAEQWMHGSSSNDPQDGISQPQCYSYFNREESKMGPPPQNSSTQINANNQADFQRPSSIMTRINITDSHLNDLKQAVQQFMPEVEQVEQTVTEKRSAPSPTSPILRNTKKADSSLKSSTSRRSLSMISAKLPADWKCKEMGNKRILYYNTKTKKSQWQYPHAKSSSAAKNKSSESQKKAKIVENSSRDKKSNNEAITSTNTTIEPDQAEKERDKATPVQSSVVVSDTASSEAFKVCFKSRVAKYYL
jgi:hypothetical protein